MHFLNRSLTEYCVNRAVNTIQDLVSEKAKDSGFEQYICHMGRENGELIYAGLKWFEVANHLKAKHRRPIVCSSISCEFKLWDIELNGF
ncbi:hypothetical protein TDB9533_01213 [Thalassocella blandensis]|nr:hypothetical protein TDB9533_01213 [Thalassocella blandensis]